MKIQSISENTLMLYLGDGIEPGVAHKIKLAVDAIRSQLGEHIIDLVPSYNSILVLFDIMQTDRRWLIGQLQPLLNEIEVRAPTESINNIVEIPVYYGDEVALDMAVICQHTGLAPDEVIRRHTARLYTVYAIGFSPGFAYLGNVDDSIALPRKQTPRTRIPAGSLGIADNQTAIYPSESPGGWNILGRTPIAMVDFSQPSLTPLNTGDQIRFVAIDKAQYLAQGGEL